MCIYIYIYIYTNKFCTATRGLRPTTPSRCLAPSLLPWTSRRTSSTILVVPSRKKGQMGSALMGSLQMSVVFQQRDFWGAPVDQFDDFGGAHQGE